MAFETPFLPDHADRVTVLQLNSDSTKLLTASVDHRIAVYDLAKPGGQRKQLDVFTAHNAEIRDAKWFHPSTGTQFVTIGNDMQLRIWAQDTYQAPMSGRRFKRVATINSPQLMPFVSVDVKTVGSNTYIVVVDRQGLLSLYEPSNPDEYHDWSLVDQFYVCSPPPERGEHTSFRARFDQNVFPLPYLANESDDQVQLGIVATAMSEVKLYRTTSEPNFIKAHVTSQQHNTTVGRGASHSLCLCEVLRIQTAPTQFQSSGSLLRDVAISPANTRGSDIIAVASSNGTVAVYDVSVNSKPSTQSTNQAWLNTQFSSRTAPQAHQSNLTSALNPTASSSQTNNQAPSRASHPFPYSHQATVISMLQDAHFDAWSVQWDPSGQTLLSSGSDGTVKMWMRSMSPGGPGEFVLFAEQAPEDDDESDSASVDEEETA